ncbi:carboxymuconolactone decarboxylase family protein [Sphingomonas sp. SUN039]|uniref:carboxymuconolactone decarboxylase family protein n=1 Tax=Sphingomonas sp. SUN039 TaxID=2937787 RepID=UPI002164DD1C|nr:carboxymuconolactone decarboxylase family protein [Sphingomonas sp. SUN039]UVO55756.1 carboxymuconolactone decarboxylase family protein [Sphingomonas sp. SUN039]
MGDPAERSALGARLQSELTGAPERSAATPMEQSWRDFVYAEVWSRPGLDRRARFLISLAGAAIVGHGHAVNAYARGALTTGEITLAELREAALHVAVYGGWSAGSLFDAEVGKVADDLGLSPADTPPICAEPWDAAERSERGAAGFVEVMKFGGPPPVTPYFEAGIRSFVFAEMWCRPGLDQRSRRWLTLVGVCESCADTPIASHIHSAMISGNCTADELHEFVLQYGIHAGWPRASRIQGAVFAMAKNVAAGLDWDGK